MMRALVTGGAGFLGSHIVDRLLATGAEVLVLDNYVTARRDSLTPNSRLTIVEGSVADGALVAHCVASFRPEQVIHAAASYKDPQGWTEDIQTNVLGTANLVRASINANVIRFVYLQTALCYGRARQNPIPVEHPLDPFTSYSITKTAGERFVVLSGLSYVSLRLANIYGPRHYSGPMPAFYKRIKEGQVCTVVDTRRDFLEIDDFLALMDRVLPSDSVGCFNVSSGRDTSIGDVFDRMVRLMGRRGAAKVRIVKPSDDDVATLLIDPTATMKTFNWQPSVNLETGLGRLVQSYEQVGVEDTFTHLEVGKVG